MIDAHNLVCIGSGGGRVTVALGPPAVGASATGPWLDPANADQYVFLGKDVWDVATGKFVAAGAAPALYQESRLVVGLSDWLQLRQTGFGLPGISNEGIVYSTGGKVASLHPTLDGKPASSYGDFPGFWIKVDGSGSEVLGPCAMAMPLQFPSSPPLDLGFGPDSPDPWAQ